MPRVARKTRTKKEISPTLESMPVEETVSKIMPPQKVLTRYLLVLFIVALLVAFFWKNKSLLVVALVNGRPVPRWSLESRMVQRFGSQTLDEIVNEQIIAQAGAKKGITISEKDVNDKVSEIEKSLGGRVTLADALAGQGLTLDEFKSQIRLQLTLESLAGSEIKVSDKEITDYIASYSATMTATDAAGLKSEAKSTLETQKKNSVLRKLFSDLKSAAKVTKYL